MGWNGADGRIDVNGGTHRKINEKLATLRIKRPQLISLAPNSSTAKVMWPLKNNIIRRGLVNNTFGESVRTRADGTKKCHQG